MALAFSCLDTHIMKESGSRSYGYEVALMATKTIFTILGGLAIGYFVNFNYQLKALETQNKFEADKRLYDAQVKLSSDLMDLIQKRFFNYQRLVEGLKDGGQTDGLYKPYLDSVTEWNIRRQGLVTQSRILYGQELAEQLQLENTKSSISNPVALHDKFAKAHAQLLELRSCLAIGCAKKNDILVNIASTTGQIYEQIDVINTMLINKLTESSDGLNNKTAN